MCVCLLVGVFVVVCCAFVCWLAFFVVVCCLMFGVRVCCCSSLYGVCVLLL